MTYRTYKNNRKVLQLRLAVRFLFLLICFSDAFIKQFCKGAVAAALQAAFTLRQRIIYCSPCLLRGIRHSSAGCI